MSIQFKRADAPKDTIITPSLKFEEAFDQWHDVTIYYDHVAVAYLDIETGGIRALLLETGPYAGGDESASVAYLEEHGVKLTKITNTRGLPYVDYSILMHEAL